MQDGWCSASFLFSKCSRGDESAFCYILAFLSLACSFLLLLDSFQAVLPCFLVFSPLFWSNLRYFSVLSPFSFRLSFDKSGVCLITNQCHKGGIREAEGRQDGLTTESWPIHAHSESCRSCMFFCCRTLCCKGSDSMLRNDGVKKAYLEICRELRHSAECDMSVCNVEIASCCRKGCGSIGVNSYTFSVYAIHWRCSKLVCAIN